MCWWWSISKTSFCRHSIQLLPKEWSRPDSGFFRCISWHKYPAVPTVQSDRRTDPARRAISTNERKPATGSGVSTSLWLRAEWPLDRCGRTECWSWQRCRTIGNCFCSKYSGVYCDRRFDYLGIDEQNRFNNAHQSSRAWCVRRVDTVLTAGTARPGPSILSTNDDL